MKKISLFIIGILTISFVYCQDYDWLTYNVDSILTVDLPGDAFEMDTTMDGIKVYSVFSNIANSHFIAQKTLMEQDNTDKNLSKLPYDSASLEKTYNGVIEGMSDHIMKKLQIKEPVMLGNFKGYHLQFVDSAGNPTYEVEVYLLNKYLYNVTYINSVDFNSDERDVFFNSIKILKSEKVSQFLGKDPAYKLGYVMGEYIFYIPILLIIALVLFFTSKKRKKQIIHDES